MKKTSVSLVMILPLLILAIYFAGENGGIAAAALIISGILAIIKIWELYTTWRNHRFAVRLETVYVFSEDRINAEIEEYGNPFSGREKKLRLRLVIPKDDVSIETVSYMCGRKVVATAEAYNEFRSWIFTEKESPATLTIDMLVRDKNVTKIRAVVKPTYGRTVKSNYIKTSQLKGISGMFVHDFNPDKEFSNLDEEEQRKL